MDDDILAALPHRPPFLFADEIVSRSPEAVVTRYTLRADDDLWSRVYAGHYPGNPLTPGVLLCEMMLQAAAILVHDHCRDGSAGVPVVTRLQEVKFRRIVRPGDQVEIRVQLD
ncbi:MAG: beta-hydroxyacyl-ACP dehydratase, partial [Planctomycetes bacterium]|nr:beta-hydroxyacyl-ACP dehydratase [Planctomycetota bacterium]